MRPGWGKELFPCVSTVQSDGSLPFPYSSRQPVKPPFFTSMTPVIGSDDWVIVSPFFGLWKSKTGCGSDALHSLSAENAGLRGKSCASSQSFPSPVRNHLRAHLSLTFITTSFLTKSLQLSFATKSVHVSMLSLSKMTW